MRRIEPATWRDVGRVAMNMRDRDFEELSATSKFSDKAELARFLADTYGDRPDVLCGIYYDTPVCIGGTIEAWPGTMSLLFFATDDFPKIGHMITRWIKRDLFPRYEKAGVHRIQAISLAGYEAVHDWLRVLGMKQEGEPLRKYGKNGEDFVVFARVAGDDVCSTGA